MLILDRDPVIDRSTGRRLSELKDPHEIVGLIRKIGAARTALGNIISTSADPAEVEEARASRKRLRATQESLFVRLGGLHGFERNLARVAILLLDEPMLGHLMQRACAARKGR